MSTHGAGPAGQPAPPAPGGYAGPPQQQPQPGDYGQGYDQQGYGQESIGDRAAHAANVVRRSVRTPETKEFFKTSEFLVWFLSALGVLIAAAAISGDDGTPDVFTGDEAWAIVAALSIGYIVSRGLSKAGTRRGHDSDGFGNGRGY